MTSITATSKQKSKGGEWLIKESEARLIFLFLKILMKNN